MVTRTFLRRLMQCDPIDRIKLVLLLTLSVFIGAAVAITLTMLKRQQALGEVARYNITWAASQGLVELQRMENRVIAFDDPQRGVTRDEVQLRLDILFNRVDVLQGGELGDFLEAEPAQRVFVDEFAALVNGLQALVHRIDEPQAREEILGRLSAITPKLMRFGTAAAQYSAGHVTSDQHTLLRLHWIFAALAGGLMVCGVVLAMVLLHQYRLLRQAHERLRHITFDLRRSMAAAQAANQSKSEFLANMSHELRTPLNAIIGFADVMARQLFGPLGHERYNEYAADILHSGQHVYDLVTDILTMARLDAASLELEPERIETRAAVMSAVQMFCGTEIARDRDVTVEPAGAWPELMADERAFRQMLLNLLSNAAKFSSEGDDIRLVCDRLPDGGLEFAVLDRGIGMTPAEIEVAIRPFQQVDSGMARKYQGAGLGLSIVKGLMERHGGRLHIRSTPGVGSAVALQFPASAVMAAAPLPERVALSA